ncbi:MAG: endonuclease/exonuclease/phosphatase family protein [Bacteroidales bacterium]
MNKKQKKRIPFFRKVLVFVNILFALGLMGIYISSYINPSKIWILGIPGLLYPLFILVNLLFMLFWMIRFKYFFLISLVSITTGYGHFQSFVQWSNTSRALPEEGINLKILSYNVRVFDLYNYGPGWKLNFENRNNIFRFMEQKDFDIIGLQEFVYDKSGKFKTLDTLPNLISAREVHTGFTQSSHNVNFFGLATFSVYPVINKGRIDLPTKMGNLCIYTDLLIEEDTVRVYNVHLESIGLGAEDYIFMENITNFEGLKQGDYLKQSGKRILGRIREGYRNRGVQADLIASHIKECPYPIILLGDFNDTPSSYVYRTISRYLEDAFLAGRGTGQTYIGTIPGFRIDYIFHSEHFKPYNFQTGKQEYSDHFPVYTWLNYTK